MIALVRHADDLIAQSQGEEELGRVGHQARLSWLFAVIVRTGVVVPDPLPQRIVVAVGTQAQLAMRGPNRLSTGRLFIWGCVTASWDTPSLRAPNFRKMSWGPSIR